MDAGTARRLAAALAGRGCVVPAAGLGQATHPQEGQVAVTAFDVGQGMALLIETSGHRLLYDTGPFYAPGSNGGNRVILPYLEGARH
ncbi:hypothetical protein LP420_00810 [Massilia sp. B-10]|nr:hypothetical protein LP420_00810 [Massilia sp. B-10]